MTPTPAPAPTPRLYPVPGPDADPIDEVRYELRTLGERLDARIDRLEDLSATNLNLAVEAIKAANKKTAGIVTAVITTIGAIIVAYIKAH